MQFQFAQQISAMENARRHFSRDQKIDDLVVALIKGLLVADKRGKKDIIFPYCTEGTNESLKTGIILFVFLPRKTDAEDLNDGP